MDLGLFWGKFSLKSEIVILAHFLWSLMYLLC